MSSGKFKTGCKLGPVARDTFIQNETKIISWIYRWGITSRRIIESYMGVQRISALSRMVKHQKITQHETGLYSPRIIYKLSELGLSLAEMRLDEDFIYPEISKDKVVTSHLTHDLLSQSLTVFAMNSGVAIDFSTPRMMDIAAQTDVKIPDATWVLPDEGLVALEVELDQKWDKKLDNFLARIIESIESGQISECLVVTNSKAVVRNYGKSLLRNSIPVWIKKTGGTWRVDREVDVRQAASSKISFVLLNEKDMTQLISAKNPPGEFKSWLESKAPLDISSIE